MGANGAHVWCGNHTRTTIFTAITMGELCYSTVHIGS